ncbi:MAG: helix-turn-helix transcriptional regulator [Clostridiales bacterium]|nr:helix-turn-helix transcriptional regulator [Clostridiales bacterium]
MTIGEKIKTLRKENKLTQNELAAGIVTRNMLSLIENDTAKPSLGTTRALAERLGVPVEYLISENMSAASFSKMGNVKSLKELLKNEEYAKCLAEGKKLAECDDETALIMMRCSVWLGDEALKDRKVNVAYEHYESADKYADMTIYATSEEKGKIKRFLGLTDAILFKKNFSDIPKSVFGECDELAMYIAALYDVDIGDFELLRDHKIHVAIHRLIKLGRYNDAKKALFDQLKITNDKLTKYYMLRSLEDCFRKSGDFKGTFESTSQKRAAFEALIED